MKLKFEKIFLSLTFLFFVSGCGQGTGNTDGLNMIMLPNTALLLPGTGSSCTDYQDLKAAILDATTTSSSTPPTLGSSVSSMRVLFQSFALEWTPTDASKSLTVALLQFTITAPQLTGGSFSTTLSGDELNDLLGAPNGYFANSAALQNSLSGSPLGKAISLPASGAIISSDPARDCQANQHPVTNSSATCSYNAAIYNPNWAACGFTVGGISVPKNAPSFSAGYTLKLIGYTIDSNFNQAPAQATTSGTISYQQGTSPAAN